METNHEHTIFYKTYQKYSKMTTTIGRCNECLKGNCKLTIKEKFCSEKCYDLWCKKKSQVTCRGICAYKFCGNEDSLKYDGRYCSKICRIAQSRDNNARKQMLEEGLPIETIDRKIKRTPVEKANHLFGDALYVEEKCKQDKRAKLRERRKTENDLSTINRLS